MLVLISVLLWRDHGTACWGLTAGGRPPGWWEWIWKPCICWFCSPSTHQQSLGCIYNTAAFFFSPPKKEIKFAFPNFTDKLWVLLLEWVSNHNLVNVRAAVKPVKSSKGRERRKQEGEIHTASPFCLAIFSHSPSVPFISLEHTGLPSSSFWQIWSGGINAYKS